MYNVSDEYKVLATAAMRKHDIDITFFHLVNGSYEQYAAYHEQEDSPIISLKIVNGQTTGGFSIGGTYCSTLEITAHINVPFLINDKVIIQTHFRTMDEASGSEWLLQGVYFIDTITANQYNVKVTALDAMARLAKDYNSELSYPATVESMLGEISSQSGVGLSNIDVFNNASIAAKPVKAVDDSGNEYYFTRREVLGYLAGINGGNAYINNNGHIAFSTPRETNYRIKSENVISQTFGAAEMTIDNVVLNKSGKSSSTADDWDENAVQLYVPLDVDDGIAAPIKQKLSGTNYEAITLKKQGTGLFEPGDLVTYTAIDGTDHKMLIMGIAYELTNGFFSETLYSLAQSSSQRQYSGSQNISQNIAPTAAAGSSEATALISNDKQYKLVLLGDSQILQNAAGDNLGVFSVGLGQIQLRSFANGVNLIINPAIIALNMGVSDAPRFDISNGVVHIHTGGSDTEGSPHRVYFGGRETFVIPKNLQGGALEFKEDGLYYQSKKLAFEST